MFARRILLPCVLSLFAVQLGLAADPPAKKKETPAAPAPNSPEAMAEQIFKQADKLHNQKLTTAEYQSAVTMVQQLAMSMPAKGGFKADAPAAGGAAPSPDLNNDKHISLEEFKAVFPTLLSQAQAQVAALRKQTGRTGTMPRKGY